MNHKKAREIIDKIETEKIRLSETLSPTVTYGTYTRAYVKELEDELSKLVEENLYLQSDEYLNKKLNPTVTSGGHTKAYSYVKELEDKVSKLAQENLYLQSDEYQNKILAHHFLEKESMTRKINLLSIFVRRLSYESINREHILSTLKAILEDDITENKINQCF